MYHLFFYFPSIILDMNFLYSLLAFNLPSYFSGARQMSCTEGGAEHKCPITPEHLEAARLCHKVYDDEYLHSSEKYVDSPETDVQCSLSVSKNILYVVFRGSDDLTDWYHNMNADLVRYPAKSETKVHAGFLVQWMSVRHEILKKITEMIETRKEKDPIETIVLTGHSAGSPPSCLCAKELKVDIDTRVITFGSPRFSNNYFKNEFKAKCTRIVLDRDVVTRFPTSLGEEYVHVGDPLQLREDEVVQRDTTKFEAFRWFLLGVPRADFGVKDHYIQNYVQAIEKFLRQTS